MGAISSWSYSRLKDFEKCPYRAFLKYALKRPEPDFIDKTAAERGQRVHKAAEDYILRDGPMVDELVHVEHVLNDLRQLRLDSPDTLHVEQDWGFTIDWEPCEWMAENVWGRMKLDACVVEDTTATLYDWKTGKKYGNEVPHAQQSQYYALGAVMRFPQITHIETRFVYTDQKGQVTPRKYTREQVTNFLPILHNRALAMTTTDVFPPKANKINCKYCPYGPSKGDGSCEHGVEA